MSDKAKSGAQVSPASTPHDGVTSFLLSEVVVATAANKACLARSRGTMKTRSLNTEVGANNVTGLSYSSIFCSDPV